MYFPCPCSRLRNMITMGEKSFIFFFQGLSFNSSTLGYIFPPNTPTRLLYRFSNAVSIYVSDLFFCHFLKAFPIAFSRRVLADQPVCTVLKFQDFRPQKNVYYFSCELEEVFLQGLSVLIDFSQFVLKLLKGCLQINHFPEYKKNVAYNTSINVAALFRLLKNRWCAGHH